ncbi:hypothetical protein STRCI_000199 [Streptomyces cinnabarinus]|uniref:Integral membrane protein n=1 Tax=Streptomyces cinnabarinus TaxID=67287 RepID=A0ABY7K5U2_9ACTN|nr:hypothetical protein [Streptomyces cinnabarinus]WAZ19165.1 hypothetical protein STRCI_000199 [Streptomyces cinnabarinus]
MSATSMSPMRQHRRVPLAVTISAWAAPVMVVGQFALLAAVPIVIALLRARDRAVRRAAGLVAAVYAIPLVIWLTRPDGAPSLSKDLHPVFLGLIPAASAVLIVAVHRAGRR